MTHVSFAHDAGLKMLLERVRVVCDFLFLSDLFSCLLSVDKQRFYGNVPHTFLQGRCFSPRMNKYQSKIIQRNRCITNMTCR